MQKRNLWLIVIPVILFAMLAVSLEAGIHEGFESWVYDITIKPMSPLLTKILIVITNIGGSIAITLICLLLIAIPATRRTIALPVSAGVIISTMLNYILKNIFARQRPDILRLIVMDGYSFPSGHAMVNTTLYCMLIFMTYRLTRNKRILIPVSTICVLLILVIGFTRIYLGVHYAMDVIAGWIMGFAVSVIVYNLYTYRMGNAKNEDH